MEADRLARGLDGEDRHQDGGLGHQWDSGAGGVGGVLDVFDGLPIAPTLPLQPPANLLPLPVQTGFMDLDTYLQFYGVPHKYQPGVLRRRRLGTALSALVCLLGALVTAVAVWLLLWAPNLPARDNPVYSGPPLVAAGLLGLVLLGCCRKDYPGRPYSCCMFSFKVLSVSLAALAALAALCASAFALLHVVSLWGSACEPAKQVVNATCTCEPAHKDPERSWAIWWGTVRHVYPDLSCPEVESLLSVILTGSGAANLLAGVLAGWYVLLHWRSRYTDVYAKVRTAPPPVVISNVSKA
ncbi:uncharacterized protein LOC117640376 isoform X2 [Thrips palmi]|uniref:Uncharacterized protein LOC117640376 isoform X2 n=1 Tax=Thrips palmi TaxID=161013 RepID=A0A6P8YFP9_THRPL|nr:uncharacterized protein LOC117640376 isoform X2 [Thrips palmi]